MTPKRPHTGYESSDRTPDLLRPPPVGPALGVGRFEDARWEVSVYHHGTTVHVQPVRGLSAVGNWAINSYQRRGLANLGAQLWRVFSGAYLRSEYPNSERRLRRAVRECEAWCEAERANEAMTAAFVKAAKTMSDFDPDGVLTSDGKPATDEGAA